jgi:hypothetical protein
VPAEFRILVFHDREQLIKTFPFNCVEEIVQRTYAYLLKDLFTEHTTPVITDSHTSGGTPVSISEAA